MIIVRLRGGLGNQMFQYAAARRLAHVRNASLGLDVSSLAGSETDIPRDLELKHLSIVGKVAAPDEITRVRFGDARGGAHLLARGLRMLGKERPAPRDLRERHFCFDPALLNAPDGVYLDGYWQSEKYFADIADIIRGEFTVRYPLEGRNRELAELIARTESVSLHVRRGDYVTNPRTALFHGTCGPDYYEQCLAHIGERVKEPHLFVFSDEPAWVEENLELSAPATFVTHNGPDRGWEDLRLMGLCRHNIIANSSFSWWGAWLNRNPAKIVIAPRKWFAGPEPDTKDLIPAGWTRL